MYGFGEPVRRLRVRASSWRPVSRLALPMALAELVDVLALLAVIALLGRMGSEALYIRSLYHPVALIMLAVTAAFAISNQVAAAISRGQGRPEAVLPVTASMARIWIGTGVALCGAVAVAAPGIAALLDVTPQVRGDFVSFLRWTSFAELSVIGSALGAAALRGFGRVGTATVVVVSVAAVRVGCVAALGLGTGIGIYSVPVASVLSGAVGLALAFVLLRRAGLWQTGQRLPWRGEAVGQLWQIGVPIAGTIGLVAAYNLAVLWILRDFSPLVVSGFSVAVNLQGLVFLPGTVLGTAIAIILNQERGAGQYGRLSRTLRSGLELTVATYLVLALGIWLAADPLAAALTGNPEIASVTSRYMETVGLTYAIQGPVLAALTLLEQIGRGKYALVLNTVYFGVIVLVGMLAVHLTSSAASLYYSIAVCNFLGVSVVVVTVREVRRMSRVESGVALGMPMAPAPAPPSRSQNAEERQ
ncbi:Na+-driven multidrug efflux pump [Sinosporangium album]|uniref:Na+-driven multidrug efflux pump n=1 Tax=Sinosporangium album TaxID=504805 RepID=A0A1G8A6C3_9ACTN|nr:MATE family efflux transporter [Sinosporangium album]SDH16478.1 Na+-driven multidrug efflux pump [Sinosporangium album]